MKLPQKIRLLDKDYKIIIKKELKCKTCHVDRHGIFSKQAITLNKKDNENQQLLTLFHESGHKFADYYNIDGSSEVFAEAFARYVYSLTKQLGDAQ